MANPEVKVPDFDELTFEEDTHTYKLNGVIVPSVTTIMKPLSDNKYKGIPKYNLDRAASKGTSVHEAIENYLKYGIEDIPEANRPFFDAFLEWYRQNNPELVASETKVYHKILGYAGTVDCLCYIDGVLTMIDFKTTTQIIDMTCSVQLEAYAQALKTHGIEVEDKMILQLKKNGGFEVKRYTVHDLKSWQVFNSLKIVYDYIGQNSH